jgi:hypothetical protein
MNLNENVYVEGTVLSLTELSRLLVHELRGVQCRCARPKQPQQTFCRACYYALPAALRLSLSSRRWGQAWYGSKRVGECYGAAYVAAVNFLTEASRMERPEWMTCRLG